MILVSKAASALSARVLPAVAGAAMANPITAVVVTAGTVGLAAWKGTEIATKSAPLVRSFKDKVHSWSAPEAVKQAAREAATKVQSAADEAAIHAASHAADETFSSDGYRGGRVNGAMNGMAA